MEKMGQHYNFTAGLVMALYIQVFGSHHYIFAAYLLLNILDWLTGWYKAGKKKEVSSKVGLRGILKKTGYWVIILIAFLIPYIFVRLGEEMLGLDLSFLSTIGWFTLSSLIINEIRSILENLVACGYQIPDILKKGLAVTEELLEREDGKNQK